jgi:hypothetical protein
MKIRILSDVCDEIRVYAAGEVVDLPNDRAARFVAVGVAEEAGATATTKAAPEAAALADESERATLPPAKKRGG